MRGRLFGLLLSTLLVASCASFGPSENMQLYAEKVAQATPGEEGAPTFWNPGTWAPNEHGYTSMRSGSLGQEYSGALVLTDRSILFQQWDEKDERFHLLRAIRYSDLQEVKLDAMGRAKRIVIRTPDYRYDSFNAIGPSGLIDQEVTEKAYEMIVKASSRK